jgi:hypothetical protein
MSIRCLAFAAAIGAAAASTPAVLAQEPHAHAHDTGELGKVSFPVSCSPEASKRFEHAMAVLHSFWWEEGDRAFNAVLEADSTCAMAYWGIAVNAWGNPFAGGPTGETLARGSAAAARAAELPARTPKEQGFIAASSALYRDAPNTLNAARLQAYADTMARVYRDLPTDDEVAIYHALALIATAPRTDTTFAQQRRAAAILNPLFARHSDHPGLAHYIIHATDSPQLASLGLDAARRYARIAPAAPHAQHMPSHIFVRLGLWDETVASNWASYRAGADYARSVGAPEVPPEALHALDYAVYGYLQRGEDAAADSAIGVARTLHVRKGEGTLVRDYNGTAMLARVPLEKSDWASAAALTVPEGFGVAPALTRFARAIGAARGGRPDAARAELAALDAIAADLAGRKENYWVRIVKIKRDAAEAWRRFATGDTTGGLALARAAADTEEVTDKHPVTPGELLPARELQADMLLAAGHPAEARQAYLATLKREPGRARSVFGAARAAQLAGDAAAAQAGYREYLELMRNADGERAELAVAKTALR